MQNDSMQFSTSCRIKQVSKQAVPQDSLVKSFQCSHCILIFKSKVYLFEHLNKVHGFDVDAALTEAGLKYIKTNKPNPDNSTSSSGRSFKCQHCDFKAFSRDALDQHEKLCQKNVESPNLVGTVPNSLETVIPSEDPDTAVTETSTNQHDEATEAKEISSVMSTSNTKCSTNSVKDLKTYKRPLQTITKYFTASSGSNGKSPAKVADGTKGTLILQDSPSSSSPNSSGVFKVTAKSMIDISKKQVDHFLRNDQLLMTDFTSLKPKEHLSERPPNNASKRPNNESSESCPAKKAKVDKEETWIPEKEHKSDQLSLSRQFSFDISDDEEERGDLVNGDAESTDVYACKHCDYRDVGLKRLCVHYHDNHPYVRYNAVYIQDAYDQSATFRCLQCPVKFLSTADLKWHYMENHPEAPDVFMMTSSQLNLVFRCFVCPFTANAVRVLKEHYIEKHPAHKVDSSLFYCRYSVTEGQEETSSCGSREKTAHSERLAERSPERSRTPCTEDKNAIPPQQPTSRGADVALYTCTNCTFSHKSVIVMHVHYQKSHPGEEITLQKIKQSACVTSPAASEKTSEKSSNSGAVTENSAPPKNISSSSKKSKDKAEVTQQKKTSSLVENPECKVEASENNTASSVTKKVESVKDRSKRKKFSTKYDLEGRMDSLSSSSSDRIFYCQFCSYSSVSVRSVVGHHNAKHSMDAPIGTDDIVWYSAEVQKMKLEMKASKSPPPSHSKTSEKMEACSETKVQDKEDTEADASVAQFNPYACAENLFYCQKCNFGNPSVKGVINHQAKTHQRINTSRELVLEYSASVHAEIKKSKSNAKEFSFFTDLPLPLMNAGDERMFFCHFCNYRSSTVKDVLRHYSKTHRGFEIRTTQIQLYTSMILRRTQKSHLRPTAEPEVSQEPPEKLEVSEKKTSSSPPSVEASQPQRTLQCYRCCYSTPYVYLLKKHIRKTHQTIRSVTEVLRVYFRRGILQSGYHCEFCVFSHENAAAVYKHYREKHTGSKTSFEYISKRLYVGPSVIFPKRKKPKLMHSDGIRGGDAHDGNLTSQRPGQKETYSCRACAFKGSSMLSVARHYRAVHALSAKQEDVDLLQSKKTSADSQKEDHDEMPELFDSYQVPLEFDKSSSEAMFKCLFCSSSFATKHGLSVHCGIKHNESVPADSEEKQKPPVQTDSRVHVFKCPYCTYVNTIYQGVLTHCQMKHPTLQSRADSLHVDSTYVQNLDDCSKKNGPGESVRFSGHMCESCPQICATLNKLSKHCEKDHDGAVAGGVQSTLTPSAVSKIMISKSYSTQGSVSKASFLSKKINAILRCQQCSYSCRTKPELSRHLRVHHKNAISKDRVYKCVLCSKIYFMTKRLAGHYAKKHGKEAYLKYYIPMYKQGFEKPVPTSPDRTSPQQPQDTSEPPDSNTTTDENKILVYRCPSCPYVNASYHGTLTHCQMKHPAVIARADELQTTEILLTNMVRCTIGKGSNERGYKCKKCPQIHASLGKLRIHCERDHGGAAVFEASPDTEPVHDSQASVPEAVSLKDETSEVNITESEDSFQPDTPAETCQSNSPPAPNKGRLYKCRMCSYAGSCRKYLYCHLKKTHKLDALSTYRLLESYNKRKRKMPGELTVAAEPEESANVKCKMCPDLMWDSPQLLLDHYNTFHGLDCKVDFTVLSNGSQKKKSTGIYRCSHCATVLYGIRKLGPHLDRHAPERKENTMAAKRHPSLVITPKPEPKSVQVSGTDELPTLETVEELTRWNVTPVKTFTLPTSPQLSPSKLPDAEQLEVESREDEHACQQCGRTFRSMKGLRAHVRSHAALAAIKKLNKPSTSALKININKFIIHKSGTVKPFLCGLCSYRTTVMGLWRSHFMKKHKDVLMDPAEAHCDDDEENGQWTDKDSSHVSEGVNGFPEFDEEAELAEESMYLEPPDVQRQLNHYNFMARSSARSKASVHESKLPENSVFYCEFCNFNSGHLSSIRRHYVSRHGKKIFKCKDCDFFTGLRKTLERHIETGHSSCPSEPPHQMDLRCPFCLYQTKNKNNMIDHIVLHREERVVPIEVRRSKLSHYLRGVVFRCHKCTFTSGSADSLRLHMTRHDDIKPYKCRLCYFDCTRLGDLEEHLSDKHQVRTGLWALLCITGIPLCLKKRSI
uniref:Zinc finger protein 462-like n=1 Tax=Stegastes partitus TaxID=144197 RepID=A0A3B5A958_9TELE